MTTIIRRSPVVFRSRVLEVERRGHWDVALVLDGEGDGPHLVDLSHCPRWDLQDPALGDGPIGGVAVPSSIGVSRWHQGVLVNRMNPTQASVWHLADRVAPALPPRPGFTDVTDATAFLAVIGRGALALSERLTNLDLGRPDRSAPYLVQGPFSNVPCQIVVLGTDPESPGFAFTCARGYARDMVSAVLHAGEPEGLTVAGERVFRRWLSAAETEPPATP